MTDMLESEEQARREAALAAADASRARIRAERNGVPLPDSFEMLHVLREFASGSPLDIPSVDLGVDTREIIDVIREGRERFG
jgi:hypothetical protein